MYRVNLLCVTGDIFILNGVVMKRNMCIFIRISFNYIPIWPFINSLSHRDVMWRQQIRSSFTKVMACRMFGSKPLAEPTLAYCQSDNRVKRRWNSNKCRKLFNEENIF